MKLQKKEMLSNFEIDGFWRELQMTMEKIVWSRLRRPPGSSREGSRRPPEASPRLKVVIKLSATILSFLETVWDRFTREGEKKTRNHAFLPDIFKHSVDNL